MSFSSGWPYRQPSQDFDDRVLTKTAKLAAARRAELIARVPLFAGLTKQQIRAIASAASSDVWPSGVRMVKEGAPSTSCFVIVEGSVEVTKGDRVLARLGPGEFFGEVALFDSGPRTATVRTVTEVHAIQLPRPAFLEVVQDNPKLLLRMITTMALRFRDAIEAN